MAWEEISRRTGIDPREAKKICDRALQKMMTALQNRGITIDDLRDYAQRRGEEQAAQHFESVLLYTITQMLDEAPR
jgi:hypothetical protein